MLSFYTFATRKPALSHYLPDFIGRLLVIRARKPNVCFADACFSFAHMLFTRKPALPRSLPDFIGRLLVIRAGNQMSASQTLAFLLHICFLLANPRFRAPCPISSGVCSLFVPETKCLLRRRLLSLCTNTLYHNGLHITTQKLLFTAYHALSSYPQNQFPCP